MMVALAGGVGGARLAVGLASLLKPRELAIVVNTGDVVRKDSTPEFVGQAGLALATGLERQLRAMKAQIDAHHSSTAAKRESLHPYSIPAAIPGQPLANSADRTFLCPTVQCRISVDTTANAR